MAKTHVLKTLATVWDAVAAGKKPWEVRRNDRFFQVGDIVVLRRLKEDRPQYFDVADDRNYRDITRRIGWLLQGGQFGIEPGYCVFSLDPLEPVKPLYWTERYPCPSDDRPDLIFANPILTPTVMYSSVEPHERWFVTLSIASANGDEEEGQVVEWFSTEREAQAYVDSLKESKGPDLPPPVRPLYHGEGQVHG